jgi:hypothetical protein
MARIAQERANSLDLLLAITEVRRVDAVAWAVGAGWPGGRHLIRNDKSRALSIAVILRGASWPESI